MMRWLGWALLGVVVLLVSFVLVASHQGWQFAIVLSGSMEPELGVGGLIVAKPVDPRNVAEGDVISYRLPAMDTPICHRTTEVIETDAELSFQTKGDANEDPDPYLVSAQDLVGKTVFYAPHVGQVTRYAYTRVTVLGRSYPAAAVLVMVTGMAFIGLTLKDTLEDTFRPYRRRRHQRFKMRRTRLAERRRKFA